MYLSRFERWPGGLLSQYPWESQFEHLANKFFEDVEGGDRYPLVNVWSNEHEAIVLAEVPGMDMNQLEVTVLKNTLKLQGERPQLPQEGKMLRRERGAGKFSKSVKLPFPVNNDKVEATYKNGILKIVLPRAEADKPKRITIN